MKVAVVYCFPMAEMMTYLPLARRFVSTWLSHPPGQTPHDLHVVLNGQNATMLELALFNPMPCRFHRRDNFAWDIGAYLYIAAMVPCDVMVCLGAHIQFHRSGWLDRAIEATLQFGPGLYGAWASLYPNPHIRTTAFWCPPDLLNAYPNPVTSSRPSRYRFEHGRDSFTTFCKTMGFPTVMVTADGAYDQEDWRGHEPDRNHSLILDKQHS